MWIMFMNYVRGTLEGGAGKQSFARVYALPFLLSALVLCTTSGIMNILHEQSVFEDASLLAAVGFALYTGGKALSIGRGKFLPPTDPTPTTPVKPAPDADHG